jgi:prophage regulatory protein
VTNPAAFQAADAICLQRLPQTLATTGLKRSALFARVESGLFTRPVKLGPKLIAWPAHETQAIVRAYVAGASEAQIAALVKALHRKRTETPLPFQPAAAVA